MRAFVDGNVVGLVNDDFKNIQESDVIWVERVDVERSDGALVALMKLREAIFESPEGEG